MAGSVNVPLDKIEKTGAAAVGDTKGELCLICESGKRAALAATRLGESETEGALVVEGGIAQWKAAGFPTEGEQGVISIERQVRIAAGSLVLAGVMLAAWVHPGFLVLPGFVGAGLMFAGITGACGMGLLLAKMPWNR